MWQKSKNLYHLAVAVLANLWFGFPSRKITVIGITGTDGKTTTASLIYHILKSAKKKTAMITTVGAFIEDKTYDVGFHVTTPSPFALQRYIGKAVEAGNDYLVLEATSHGLDQNRIFGVNFSVGVITNVSHEHLDYHKNYGKYLEAKAKLLKSSKIVILNKDDQSYKDLSKVKSKTQNQRVVTYGTNKNSDVNPYIFPFETNLTGQFNKYNCLAAIAAAKQIGIDAKVIKEAIKNFIPPLGRQEVVYKNGFSVMIDFAHTPNAFEQILSSLKNEKVKIIHVFGCAGKRDKTKRPLMGAVSSKYADVIILTSEDPRGESVNSINREIMEGLGRSFVPADYKNHSDKLENKRVCFNIEDRKEAIKFAISLAKEGDLVILTGKSHEKTMNYGSGEVPWDEFKAAEEALKLKNNDE